MRRVTMKNSGWNIGVCSWSLQAEINDVAAVMKNDDINHVHLAVGPALADNGEYLAAVKQQDWVISSTMIAFAEEDYSSLDAIKVTGGVVPDDSWEKNKKIIADAAKITSELGVQYLSFHAGFIDHTDTEKYQIMCDRIKTTADIAAGSGIMLLMETGQESAADLAGFMKDINHPSVAINFDPANMILYDKGDPIEAVKVLSPWIKHVHIKDAIKTEIPGQWGAEVPWGDGQVGSEKFLTALKEIGYEGAIAIEREAGNSRIDDITSAVGILKRDMSKIKP